MMYFQDLVAFAGSLMIFIFICIWVTCLSNICADNFYLKKKQNYFLLKKNTNMPSLWEKLLNTRLPKIFNRNLSWCLHCVPKPLTNCIIHNIHFKINSNLINDIRSLCACWNYVPTFFFYLSIKHMYHNTFNIFQVLNH